MVWHPALVERNRKVVEAREAGMTLTEVSRKFALSRERVRQITLNAERDQPVLRSDILKLPIYLSTRARALLLMMRHPNHELQGYRLIGIGHVDEDGDGFYLHIPNFSRKTIAELAQAGLIEAKNSTGLMQRDIACRWVSWRLVT